MKTAKKRGLAAVVTRRGFNHKKSESLGGAKQSLRRDFHYLQGTQFLKIINKLLCDTF